MPEVSLERDVVEGQPADANTTVAWRFKQGAGSAVRFSVEYVRDGGAPVRIPADLLTLTPAAAAQADDTFLGSSAHGAGQAYRAVWDHQAQTGQVEVRNVAVQVRFAGAERGGDQVVVVLPPQTIGRELGTIDGLRMAHVGDDESPLSIDCEFDDAGDDPAHFDLEYSVERDSTGNPIWVAPITPPTPTVGEPRAEGNRVRRAVNFTLDPTVQDLPFGDHDEFAVRVRATETYARFPLAPQTPGARTAEWLPIAAAIKIGLPPRVLSLGAPDPSLNRTGGMVHDEPRLVLPITLRIASQSSRTQRVRLGLDYSVNKATYQACTLRNDDPAAFPATAREIDLAPGESRSHHLLWNVVADEGLGIRIDATHLARVRVTATVVEARASRGLASRRESDNITTLSTPAFVRFQQPVVDPAEQMVIASDPITRQTRDVFYTRLRGQEFFVNADQKFASVAIPGLREYDVRRQGVSNGFAHLVPTDMADGPDCIGRVDGRFFHLAWPTTGDSGPVVDEVLPAPAGGDLSAGPGQEFVFTSGGRVLRGVLMHGAPPINSLTDEGTIQLMAIVRDASNNRWLSQGLAVTRFLPRKVSGAVQDLAFQVVVGDFDGDPSNSEIVVGNPGIERATAVNQGWFHLFHIRDDGAGGIAFLGPFDLPAPPFGAEGDGEPDRAIAHWQLGAYPDPDQSGRVGVLLSRTFEADAQRTRVHAFDLLRQSPAGGFAGAPWNRLPTLEGRYTGGALGAKQLQSVFVSDLDGTIGGTSEPELIAVFHGAAGVQTLDAWLLVRAGMTRLWRQTLANVPPERAGALRYTRRLMLADVDGDHVQDLVVQEEDAESRAFYYFASARSGAPGGLGLVPPTAQTTPSQRPGVADFNHDGYLDLIAAGGLHTGRPDGEFDRRLGGLAGQGLPLSIYTVQQVFDVGVDRRPNQDFIAVTDDEGGQAYVQTLVVESDENIASGESIPVRVAGAIRDLVPFVPPGRVGAGTAKDLAVVVGDGENDNRLHRLTFGGTEFSGGGWPGFHTPIRRDVIALHTQPLDLGDDAARNSKVQDVVVAQSDSNRVLVLRSSTDYTTITTIEVGEAADKVLRLAAGSVTADAQQDVMVLTGNGGVLRLWCIPRAEVDAFGSPILFLQFDDSPAADFRGMAFDPNARELAQGVLVFKDGVRVVMSRAAGPLMGGAPVVSMIRSQLPRPIDSPLFGMQISDLDGDGQLEVTCGSISPTTSGPRELLRLDRGYRSRGQ